MFVDVNEVISQMMSLIWDFVVLKYLFFSFCFSIDDILEQKLRKQQIPFDLDYF